MEVARLHLGSGIFCLPTYEIYYLETKDNFMKKITKFKIILITAIITLILSVGFSTYAVVGPYLRATAIGQPVVVKFPQEQIIIPSPNPTTPPEVLSTTELRFRAIEARLNKLEAKVK